MTLAIPMVTPKTRPRGVDDLLVDARRRLRRLDPHDSIAAQRAGALLVDTRPELYREFEGTIPGAVVIERNVLEWRLDPQSAACLDIASYDLHVIVFCNEGYASSLAAVALQELGITHATDMDGGYRAWRAAGLPVQVPGRNGS